MNLEPEIEKTENLIACAQELEQKFRSDPHRPKYHFMPPSAWMNDINGAIFWKGRYHIFYQHNPEGGYWNWMQWGHASSIDLVHWVHHPIALTPTLDGPDRNGCFSGGAFISKEGIPTFIYYGVPDGTCLASSQDDMLINWTKHPDNPVTPEPTPDSPDFGKYTIHDPSAWLDGDICYQITNRRDTDGKGDAAYLFRAHDLDCWEYVGLFYQSDRRWTEFDEDCAVPDFFPLEDKYMLLFCSHLQGTQYYLGRLQNELYHPEIHGRMSWPGGQLGGARTLLDSKGRRVFFDWVRELQGSERERASGWSGVMTLPRILSLADDGTLCIQPVPELKVLRMNPRTHPDVQLATNSDLALDNVQGRCLELSLDIEPQDAQEFGVKVRCSPDGDEQTIISCHSASKKLKVDVSKSTLDEKIVYNYYRNTGALDRLPEEKRVVKAQEAPFELSVGETLNLRIFLDHSILEVYANSRQCITQRIYPTRSDSVGISLFSGDGSVNVKSIRAWDMAPANN